MNGKRAELLLAAVILARSTSYLFAKIGLRGMDTFNLLGVRFTLAFLLLLPFFWRRLLHLRPVTVLRGFLIGGAFFAVMTAELRGLSTTPASATSFLVNTAIVFVPLFEAALRRKAPSPRTLAGTLTALTGVALLTLRESLSITSGELWCLLAAVLYACSIILTDRLSKRDDPLALGILQVGFVGLLGLAFSFLFETPRLPSGGEEWGAVLALAVVCTGFGFTLQPLAQSRVTTETAGLMCALNPASAAALGALFLGERLGARGLLGAALVLFSVLLPHIKCKRTDPLSAQSRLRPQP